LSARELQVEMAAARERDQADLIKHIDQLVMNDQSILHALQDGTQRICKLEELVIAFTKVCLSHCSSRFRPQTFNGTSTIAKRITRINIDGFIQSATTALQRLSNKSGTIDIPPWSLTSFEVMIDRVEPLGVGNFGYVYKGDWNGQVNMDIFLFNRI
jgi:hypothetical protein